MTGYGTYLEDKPVEQTQLVKISKCFSLKKNIKSLFDNGNEDIPIIHVARLFNAVGLLLSHKQMAMLFNPVINRTHMMEVGHQKVFVLSSFLTFRFLGRVSRDR